MSSTPFIVCGITAITDGSDNGDIHCLKLGHVAASAAEGYYCLGDSLTKLGENDGDDYPFASGLGEEEAVIEDE